MLPYLDKLRKLLGIRSQVYQTTFDSPEGQIVLADLARFCHAHESTFHPNKDLQMHLEGRREVWLRIQRYLKLTDDEIWDLYRKENTPQG